MLLKPNMTILFQGDSITKGRRDFGEIGSLGEGFVRYVSAFLTMKFPTYNLKYINRGVSGDTSGLMLARWEEECIALKPDLLSVMVGINDTWARYNEVQTITTAEEYEANYRAALARTREALGDIPIIMLEPFLLPFVEDKEHWREDLNPRLLVARKLAKEFGAVYIPLDGIFAQKAIASGTAVWSADGAHPTDAGHMLIAEHWIKAVLEN